MKKRTPSFLLSNSVIRTAHGAAAMFSSGYALRSALEVGIARCLETRHSGCEGFDFHGARGQRRQVRKVFRGNVFAKDEH